MIRIQRCPEPPQLQAVRETRLNAARIALRKGEPIDLTGYAAVTKPDLFAMQQRKCCYCEKLEEQAKYRDVEHYRPKARYWWLTWTWNNLLFSCIDCNREYKRDQFPLTNSSDALEPEQTAPGAECPLVIDPTDPETEPRDEIEFRRETLDGLERWRPWGLSDRGWKTIEVCGLDRPSLLDLYRTHVKDRVRPKLDSLRVALKADDTKAVVHAWSRAKRGLLAPSQPFRALSHDALNVLVKNSDRQEYRLEFDELEL